jgi:hypothetical protein
LVKHLIKMVLHTLAPKQYDSLMAARQNRFGQRIMASYGVPAITADMIERYGPKVLGGPFAGMVYIAESAGASLVPKLIGSYECELHGVFEKILASHYDIVVDVGCAEGFYAVGLSMHLPGTPRIYAFDINPAARKLCQILAKKNGVADKVIISGHCDPERLQKVLHGRSLVISDCEGYEVDLLQPAVAPALANADILVELHDILKPGVTPTIMNRFTGSHNIQLIDSTDRDPADYPVVEFLTPEQRHIAVSEFRHGPQQWAFMTPKAM